MSRPRPEPKMSKKYAGRLGGLKGGQARAESLTPERRQEIARKAAEKRWGRNSGATDENILHDRKKL